MAVEHEFQAFKLAEAPEEMQAYEAQSHKLIRGWAWPKATKPLSRIHKSTDGVRLLPGRVSTERDKESIVQLLW